MHTNFLDENMISVVAKQAKFTDSKCFFFNKVNQQAYITVYITSYIPFKRIGTERFITQL